MSAWSFRLLQEDKKSTSSKFITLTYADETLPITRNGYRSLCKRDLQLFFKNLRKIHSKGKRNRSIKYFAVGEYGGKVGRPHYHIILFNADIGKIREAWYTDRVINSKGVPSARILCSDGRTRSWITPGSKVERVPVGHIDYGDKRGVSGASVGYCLKYILKPRADTGCPDDDSQKPFVVQSKGLGLNYLYDELPEYTIIRGQNGKRKRIQVKEGVLSKLYHWHRNDINHRMYCNVDKKKISMPRYYKDRIYDEKEREDIGNYSRDKFAEDILQDLFKEYNSSNAVTYYEKVSSRKRSYNESMKAEYRKQQSLINQTMIYEQKRTGIRKQLQYV